MAHRGVCPDMACERVAIEAERQPTERKAIKVVADELGVPINTVKAWVFRNKVGANAPIEAKSTPAYETETCATRDYHTLTFDSGHKKILFSIHLTDNDLYLVMQEFKVGRNGKETPTKNRFTMSDDNIREVRSGFDKFFQVDYRGMYRERDIGGSDPPKDDEAELPAGDDGGDTQDNEHDAMGVETEPSPAPADGAEATVIGTELVQCVDCVNFAVKTWAPDENGPCNSRSGPWNGEIFQPPHEPHTCPNFSPCDQKPE